MKRRMLSLLLALSIWAAFTPPAAADAGKPVLLALGDSISTGYGLPGYVPGQPHEGSFVNLAANALGMTPVSFAIDGLTSAGLLAMLEDPSAALTAALETAAVISLQIGGNDLLRLAPLILLGGLDQAVFLQVMDNLVINWLKIIEIIQTNHPAAVIIAQTLYNPYPGLADGAYFEALNITISDGAGYITADVYAALDKAHVNVFPDPHPNVAGHAVIAQTMLDTVRITWIQEAWEYVIRFFCRFAPRLSPRP